MNIVLFSRCSDRRRQLQLLSYSAKKLGFQNDFELSKILRRFAKKSPPFYNLFSIVFPEEEEKIKVDIEPVGDNQYWRVYVGDDANFTCTARSKLLFKSSHLRLASTYEILDINKFICILNSIQLWRNAFIRSASCELLLYREFIWSFLTPSAANNNVFAAFYNYLMELLFRSQGRQETGKHQVPMVGSERQKNLGHCGRLPRRRQRPSPQENEERLWTWLDLPHDARRLWRRAWLLHHCQGWGRRHWFFSVCLIEVRKFSASRDLWS